MRPLTAKRILSSSWRPHEIRHAISCRVYIVSAGKWAIIVLAWPCAGWTFLQGLGAEGCCRHLLGCRHVRDLQATRHVMDRAGNGGQGPAPDGAGTSGGRKRKASLARDGPAAGTRSVQRRQEDGSIPATGRDSQQPSSAPSAEQQQLDAMLLRLPEVPFSKLPLGATIAHRENRLVSFRCTCSHVFSAFRCCHCQVLQHAAVTGDWRCRVLQIAAVATDWCWAGSCGRPEGLCALLKSQIMKCAMAPPVAL